jgi:hypothetical protein
MKRKFSWKNFLKVLAILLSVLVYLVLVKLIPVGINIWFLGALIPIKSYLDQILVPWLYLIMLALVSLLVFVVSGLFLSIYNFLWPKTIKGDGGR